MYWGPRRYAATVGFEVVGDYRFGWIKFDLVYQEVKIDCKFEWHIILTRHENGTLFRYKTAI